MYKMEKTEAIFTPNCLLDSRKECPPVDWLSLWNPDAALHLATCLYAAASNMLENHNKH